MSLAEGECTSFLTKKPLWQVINHEISLKRTLSANQDDNHREERFAIGINLQIGIDRASAWKHSMSTFNIYGTLYLSPAGVTLIGQFLSTPKFGPRRNRSGRSAIATPARHQARLTLLARVVPARPSPEHQAPGAAPARPHGDQISEPSTTAIRSLPRCSAAVHSVPAPEKRHGCTCR